MARAGITRQRLIDTAAQMADEVGFASLTLAMLARHFDVRLASLYAHIANVEDLRIALALTALKQLADRTEAAIAGRAGRDALLAIAEAHRDFASQHPGLFDAARHRLDPQRVAASDGPRMARLNVAALRGYGLTESQQVHAIRLLGSFLLGFALLEGAGNFDHSQPPAEASWLVALNALDSLFQGWSAPSSD